MAVALAAPVAADASSVANSGYSSPAGQTQSDVASANQTQTRAQDAGSSLPFTGFDVGMIATGGGLLLGFGLVLNRAARRAPPPDRP